MTVMNKKMLRIISGALALSLVIPFAGCNGGTSDDETTTAPEESSTAEQHVYDGLATNVTKAETVYVNLDANGNKISTIVSDKLHSDLSQVKLMDKSDLSNIVNVKGTELPIINGTDVEWNIETNDLFYRGYTDKELPAQIGIKYFIDGDEVTPEELKGKSGKLRIEITMTNTLYEEKEINGVMHKIYNPMLMFGGLILPEDSYANITSENGRFISDGSKTIVFFAGMPGVSDTLGIESDKLKELGIGALADVDLSGKYIIEAEVTDCKLGNMYFAGMPLSGLVKTFKLSDDINSLTDILETLSELANALKDVDTQKIMNALSADGNNLNQLTDVLSDASKLYENNKALIETLTTYMTPENIQLIKNVTDDLKNVDMNTLSELANDKNLKKLITDLEKTDLKKYEELLKNPLFKAFFSDISSVASDAQALMPSIEKLSKALKGTDFNKLLTDIEALMKLANTLSTKLSTVENQAAIDKMPETIEEVKRIASVAEQNSDLINTLMEFAGSDDLKKITELLENSQTDSMKNMLKNLTDSDVKAEDTVALFREMLDFGAKNTVFSAAADNTETSLMFIFKTAAIE